MRVEIDNIREVKEVVIATDGSILSQLPEYAGHLAKIVILDQKGRTMPFEEFEKTTKKTRETDIELNIIEGIKYKKGLKRSREAAKDFVRYVMRNLEVIDKTQSWITLKNGTQIRYSNSVVYEGDEGDFLWYSFSYDDLTKHLKAGNALLAFIIRGSRKMIYIKTKDVINELKKARDLRNNDWLHVNLIFSNVKIKFHMKTGKGNEPIEREFSQSEHYVSWQEFVNIVEVK